MRKPVRIKARAQEVPQTREEADRLLGEIGALSREIERVEADLTDQVARLMDQAKAASSPLGEALKSKFAALTAWAEAHKGELLDGKRRSVGMTHGTIGWRMGTPAVKVARGQEETLVKTLLRLDLGRFLRTAVTLDKEAILKDPAAVEGIVGLTVEQKETFFAKPLDVELEQQATVLKITGREVQAADAA